MRIAGEGDRPMLDHRGIRSNPERASEFALAKEPVDLGRIEQARGHEAAGRDEAARRGAGKDGREIGHGASFDHPDDSAPRREDAARRIPERRSGPLPRRGAGVGHRPRS